MIYSGNTFTRMAGGDTHTTKLRMELLATVTALEQLREPCKVELYTTFEPLHRVLSTNRIAQWRAHGWTTADHKAVPEWDLWQRLYDLSSGLQLRSHFAKI